MLQVSSNFLRQKSNIFWNWCHGESTSYVCVLAESKHLKGQLDPPVGNVTFF